MNETRPGRLRSVDALRGFDMLWILGGSTVMSVWASTTAWPPFVWIESQCHHVEWNGFRFWDLVFPLFLFLAGVSLPFSFTRRLERGHSRARLHAHVLRRAALLVLLGAIYNGLLQFDFATQRWASVLGRIGLAWAGAALLWLHLGTRGQVAALIGLLLGYWALLTLVPVPGQAAPSLEPGQSLVDWFDRQFLPGRLHRGVRDPEGWLATLPAIGTASMGILTGTWLRREDVAEPRKSTGLVLAGLLCLAIGGLWQTDFPLNKNLWTSSFVLWCAGWSLLLLALFHVLIDLARVEKPFRPLIHIGTNAITLYLAHRFVDFDGLAALALAPAVGKVHEAILAAGGILLVWLLAYALFRKGWFLRV